MTSRNTNQCCHSEILLTKSSPTPFHPPTAGPARPGLCARLRRRGGRGRARCDGVRARYGRLDAPPCAAAAGVRRADLEPTARDSACAPRASRVDRTSRRGGTARRSATGAAPSRRAEVVAIRRTDVRRNVVPSTATNNTQGTIASVIVRITSVFRTVPCAPPISVIRCTIVIAVIFILYPFLNISH